MSKYFNVIALLHLILTCQDGDDCLFEIRHVGQVHDLGVNHQDLAEVT